MMTTLNVIVFRIGESRKPLSRRRFDLLDSGFFWSSSAMGGLNFYHDHAAGGIYPKSRANRVRIALKRLYATVLLIPIKSAAASNVIGVEEIYVLYIRR